MIKSIINLRKALAACLLGALALPGNAAYRDVVLADSPYRYWTFDATNDQQIFDQVAGTPNTRLQTGSGAQLVNHLDILSGLALGKTLAPSGGADYSSAYNGDLFAVGSNLTGSYVFETWFKSNRTDQPETALVMIGLNKNTPSLVYDPADHSVRLISGATSTGRASVGGNATGWHHVVIGVLQDGSSNVTNIRARIDGVNKTITNGTYNADVNFGAAWDDTFFGVHGLAGAGDKQFYGYVDEIAVYDLGTTATLTDLDNKMTALGAHYAAATVEPEFVVLTNPQLPAIPTNVVTQRTLTVTNNAAGAITLNSVAVAQGDAALFTVADFPPTLAAGTKGTITLDIAPGALAADLATTLTVQSTAANPVTSVELSVRALDAPSEYGESVLQSGAAIYYPLDPVSFIEGYTGSGTGQVAQEIISKTVASRIALSSGATTDTQTPQGYGWSLKPNAGQPYNSMYNPSLSPIAPDFLGSYAIELWFKSDSATQGTRGLLRVANAGTPSPALVFDSVANSVFLFSGNNSANNATGPVAIPGNPSAWHHVVIGVLQDGTGTVTAVKAAIDGNVTPITLGTFNADIAFGPGGSAVFGLGNASGANLADQQFNGWIDEIALYNFGPVYTESELNAKMTELADHYSALPTAAHSAWTFY
jgi:hypothetical protein